MNEPAFANTPPEDRQLARLSEALAAENGEARELWALIDVALVGTERFDTFCRRHRLQAHNAFAHSPLAPFGDHAPHFLRFSDAPAAWPDAIARLYGLVGDATALSWLRSGPDLAALQATAAYLGKVRIQDRKAPVHCRFADTRVLPGLLRVLRPDQGKPLRDALHTWHWLDREGELRRWDADNDDPRMQHDAEATLTLSIGQFRAMQAEAEPDTVFALLLDKTPELVPGEDRGRFHARLRRCLQLADVIPLRTPQDRQQFVVLSLSSGEGFHEIPALHSTWNAVAEGRTSLCEAMRSWGADIWDALESRHALAHA